MDAILIDYLAHSSGFIDAEEMRALLLRVPLRTPEQRRAYERWAEADGTKDGLERMLEAGTR